MPTYADMHQWAIVRYNELLEDASATTRATWRMKKRGDPITSAVRAELDGWLDDLLEATDTTLDEALYGPSPLWSDDPELAPTGEETRINNRSATTEFESMLRLANHVAGGPKPPIDETARGVELDAAEAGLLAAATSAQAAVDAFDAALAAVTAHLEAVSVETRRQFVQYVAEPDEDVFGAWPGATGAAAKAALGDLWHAARDHAEEVIPHLRAFAPPSDADLTGYTPRASEQSFSETWRVAKQSSPYVVEGRKLAVTVDGVTYTSMTVARIVADDAVVDAVAAALVAVPIEESAPALHASGTIALLRANAGL